MAYLMYCIMDTLSILNLQKNGDFLIVSITSDEFVNKGKGRPIFNSVLRAEVLSSIPTSMLYT